MHSVVLIGHTGTSRGEGLAISPDGTMLAATDHEKLRIWNLATGAERSIDGGELLGHVWFVADPRW